jgi:L-seryl-tRNA(Ser) seleniumtransferase
LARSLADIGLPHPLLVHASRRAIARGDPSSARGEAERLHTQLLQPLINATGVLLHTNLGRAPSEVAQPASYTNLEFDLTTGQRGSRQDHVGSLLARTCEAEAAMVVNNGAAAVMVALASLAGGRAAAVSRGELIEIGGGFRLPEIMALSGTRLVEVGTTNRTRLQDYAAVAAEVALVLKVHTSNYRVEGFVGSVGIDELKSLDVPILADVGSGLLDATCPWLPEGAPAWLASEPAVRQSLEAGADLVTFSGDKLLGGPQAGIIAGRADLVADCVKHPLYRACRPGGMVLAALQNTAIAYLDRSAHRLPFWQMASVSAATLRDRAKAIAAEVGPVASAEPCSSVVGGGALPGINIPSWGLVIGGDHRSALRRCRVLPIVARINDDKTVLDLRTVDPAHDAVVGSALRDL